MKNTCYANFANNSGMMNAYYAQIRGNASKGGYTGGFHGHYNRISGGRNNIQQSLFNEYNTPKIIQYTTNSNDQHSRPKY